jgi:KDO2-lipid IV(A) lauroyltransferase
LAKGAHLAILIDQKMNDGIPVPFFGRPAMTTPVLAKLAQRFKCPVVPARIERLQGAHFRLTVFEPMAIPDTGNPDADAATLMREVHAMMEGWIRHRPDQWFWLHRRWPDD